MDFLKKNFFSYPFQNTKTEYAIISLLNSIISDTLFDEKISANDSLVNSGVIQCSPIFPSFGHFLRSVAQIKGDMGSWEHRSHFRVTLQLKETYLTSFADSKFLGPICLNSEVKAGFTNSDGSRFAHYLEWLLSRFVL